MNNMQVALNTHYANHHTKCELSSFTAEQAKNVRKFHATLAEYAPTPLHPLHSLASALGVNNIYVKDESHRFGLNAFKALGASYAIGNILSKYLHIPLLQVMQQGSANNTTTQKSITFATATDGNHGKAIAWAAAKCHQKAVVYMPSGSDIARAEAIRAMGATCIITDVNYDETVRMVQLLAQQNNWVVVQDTAWEGYEEVPIHIMQGYTTLALEAQEQLVQLNAPYPTHVFLQAGVGSFAAAIIAFFASQTHKPLPYFIIVEPHAANCYYQSFIAADGTAHKVTGSLNTLMAGLACGEPSSISWPIISHYAKACASCHDTITALGMRVLASPIAPDAAIISGESGAAPLGALYHILTSPHATHYKQQMGLTSTSNILVISTEGNTSPNTYTDIVWHGTPPYTAR